MRTLEEVKKAPQYLYCKPLGIHDILCGKLKLSTGVECSFCAGWNEDGMEHVSIELYARRLPTWNEMCEVKDIFWNDEEQVVQIHPKKSEYINLTEALHLWRPVDGDWSILGRNINGKQTE